MTVCITIRSVYGKVKEKKSKRDLRQFLVAAPYKPPKIHAAISEYAAECYRGYDKTTNKTHRIWPISPKRSRQRIAASRR